MFIAALFMVDKTWEQPKRLCIDDWIKKMWYLNTMEYYPAIRKDEILPFMTAWMDLENIMLRETSQSEKIKNHMISFICRICN